jgi:hypothetical protein
VIAIGAAILFILIGSIAFPAESETAIFLFDHTAKSLFAPIYPFTIQNALYVMFAFGVGDLWVRYRAAAREKAYLDLELLPEGDEVIQINQLGAIRRRIAALDAPEGAFLPQLIDESILQLQNSKSLEQTVSIYTSMLELITHRLDLAYQTIRYLVWIIPTTGFIGTVVGIARRCAPSLRPTVFRTMHGLRELLARGYVVTATDYPGLGTTGPHPYLVGVSEGRAVLDSVRAARNFRNAAAGERYALWGHSQGGHAVLFAGEISERYAPELKLAGIAAAAPATELGPLIKMDLPSITGKILGAYALKAWSEVFGLSLADIVLQRSMLVFDRVAEFCNET